ncbi:hypothetical protein, variant 1 [Aphanomyces astaci]|uniref:WDR19 first beta-propeller domain-containing protein n=1 Tax=Aphanomyces astaci TaxID=112090 RepID=W4FE48_APHAT|nr:hypothetical protein, variant 1 [Aphanomyces astaci]ETV65755.1 hypothetical protein, variant 1 [Aphanomyces astaci]|eukprot:XP_009844731.1 hypothetical protein, variant 1 [Aphanomyces astaci]
MGSDGKLPRVYGKLPRGPHLRPTRGARGPNRAAVAVDLYPCGMEQLARPQGPRVNPGSVASKLVGARVVVRGNAHDPSRGREREGDHAALMEQSQVHHHGRCTYHVDSMSCSCMCVGVEDNCMLLAIGTSRGQVVFYDMPDEVVSSARVHRVALRPALAKHKKKILCGDWNAQNEFAFGSEDRQVSICYGKDGSVIDQVKIKAAPVGIHFGGRRSTAVKRIVSVNMGRETILLYDLNEKDNALELAFQARYGDIVDYRWFGAGYIVAGFSLGYVVVISTHMNEIGQEQYCAKFHDTWLHAICYNEINGMVATCGDACIKVVRMADWKEIAMENLHRDAAAFDDLNWTVDGRLLSVSCHNGWLHHFKLVHMEQACTTLDSAALPSAAHLIAAILTPFTPPVLVFTVVSMVGCITLAMSWALEVSVWQLLQAMFGFGLRL